VWTTQAYETKRFLWMMLMLFVKRCCTCTAITTFVLWHVDSGKRHVLFWYYLLESPNEVLWWRVVAFWGYVDNQSDVSDLLISKTNWTGWRRTQSPVCYIVKPNDIYFFCWGLGLECHHLMTLASHWSSGKKLSESMCGVSSYLSALPTSVQCYHIYNFHHPRL
jgi:hypothetical protein